MKSLYYFAAWTDSGCLCGCSHEHDTVTEAVGCISCAGGYVVGVEKGELRAMTAVEQVEFNNAIRSIPAGEPPELHSEESGFAVMVQVTYGWETWMRYPTYEEAAVRGRSANHYLRNAPHPQNLANHRLPGAIVH
jgi:hypothetical protein